MGRKPWTASYHFSREKRMARTVFLWEKFRYREDCISAMYNYQNHMRSLQYATDEWMASYDRGTNPTDP